MKLTEWYETAFGADYLQRYSHRNREEAERGVRLLLRHLPRGWRGPAFDLCCGAGRHAVALRAAGVPALGGDLSHSLLRAAAHDAARAGYTLPLVRMDMRRLPFRDCSLGLVTNFFTAFGYFDADGENFGVLAEVARVLRPGGWFLMDFLNRETAVRAIEQAPHEEFPSGTPGGVWLIDRCLTPDGRRAQKHQQEWRNGAQAREVWESVRLYSPQELEAAFRAQGLKVLHRWGDYTGEALDVDASPRCILLAQRR